MNSLFFSVLLRSQSILISRISASAFMSASRISEAYAAAVYLRLSKEDGDVCDGSCSKESRLIVSFIAKAPSFHAKI